MSQEPISILAVCTGNVCRSPAVERLLASKLGPTASVSSAGTHALVGHPISEPMAALLRDGGVEPDAFEARRLSEQMLKEADLILAMTRAQRGLVVELWPADANGAYPGVSDRQPATPGQAFLGWGRLGTNEDGTCEFQTIRPGRVAIGDGRLAASHVDVCVFARGLLRHIFTRIYFAGDPALSEDPVLALVPEDRRETLLAHLDGDVWVFDLRLQGKGETVFFDL